MTGALMKGIKRYLFFVVLCCLWGRGTGLAETMYVTDRLYLSLRNAPDLEQPSLAVVPSNTKVEVLETEDNWARVTLDDGRTGWVLKKYLVRDLPKSLIIEQLQGQIKKDSLTIEDLGRQIKDMSLTIKQLQGQVKSKSLHIEQLEGQIRDKSVVAVQSGGQIENMPLILERLREENASLKKELSDLAALKARETAMKKEIEDLKKKNTQQNGDPRMATENQSLAKRKEVYVIAIVALLVGLTIGYLVRRPDKNRFYLK